MVSNRTWIRGAANSGVGIKISVITFVLTVFFVFGAPVFGEEEIYYFINDHLGTPQKLIDQNARVVWEAEALPFGETIVNEDPDGDGKTVTCNLRFPGQYYDAETGWHYNYHRYYDPKLGRYLRADPIREFNNEPKYIYVQNNPLIFMDVFGLERMLICLNTDHLILYDDDDCEKFKTGIVHGSDETPTPTGSFVLGRWIKDLTSDKWGWQSKTPWGESWWGGNVFGPYYVPILGAGNIGIHGTLGPRWSPLKQRPWESGSHGCIRLTNRDIIKLHDELLPNPSGTAVEIKANCK